MRRPLELFTRIPIASALAVLAALTLAASPLGAATLTISGSCPGQITIDIEGATPSANGGLVGATDPGLTIVPGGVCAGTPLGLDGAGLLRIYQTDASGDHSITRTLPDNLCGFLLQSIDLATCQTTTVEAIPGGCAGWQETTVSDGIVGPLAVAAADLDADGDADLLTAGWLDDKVIWWENGSAGASWTEHVIASGFDGAGSIAVADLDGDGDSDVVAASIDGEEIRWWENLGGAGSWSERLVDSSFSHPRSVVAADLDGDTDLDLVATAFDGNSVSWIENLNGAGTAWQKHPIAAATFGGGIAARITDIDGDGDPDVAAAGYVEGEIAWWRNDGTGGGWQKTEVDTTATTPREIEAADVDGDGDTDLVAALDDPDTVRWYENLDGAGASWAPRTIDGAFDGAGTVSVVDMDGDLDLDVVGGAIWDDDVVWWENAGDGSGWTPHTVAGNFDAPYDLVTADFDGDGDRDVAGVAHLGNSLAWWQNDGAACRAVERP